MSILKGQRRIQFGTTTIAYDLTFSERKTLAIHVYPDGSVVVDAPIDTSLSTVEQKVAKRAAWIIRQQRKFETYPAVKALPRRYVSGESFRYLGRQFRLKVTAEPVERVLLTRGYLMVDVPNPGDKPGIERLVHRWYLTHAQRIFNERLAICYPRVALLGIAYPELAIREMKLRWGSCSPKGRITLNLSLIQLPKYMIDYVILHELCHLKEHNHSTGFYALLDRILPDWREVRQALNEFDLS